MATSRGEVAFQNGQGWGLSAIREKSLLCNWGLGALGKANFAVGFLTKRLMFLQWGGGSSNTGAKKVSRLNLLIAFMILVWIMQALAYCTRRRWRLDQQSSSVTSGGSGKRKVSATAVPRSVCGNGPCCVQGLPVGEQTALVCSALAHGTASLPEWHQTILFRWDLISLHTPTFHVTKARTHREHQSRHAFLLYSSLWITFWGYQGSPLHLHLSFLVFTFSFQSWD